MSIMDLASAKMIGAGIAAIGMGGAAIGVGLIFANFLNGALRNPGAAPKLFGNLMLGFAVTERSEEHTSELQSLMRLSYAVFCLKKKKKTNTSHDHHNIHI